jgi:hypothetical protein
MIQEIVKPLAVGVMRRRHAWLVPGGAVIAALILGFTPAAASCNPGRTAGNEGVSHFAAWERNAATSVGGAYAQILNYEPYVQPYCGIRTPCDESVMQVGITNSATFTIAQAGFEVYEYGPPFFIFCEYINGSGSSVFKDEFSATSYGAVLGHSDYYTILYGNAGANKLSCQHRAPGGGAVTYDTRGPYTEAFNQGQIFGETHNDNSQMPGGTIANDTYSDAHYFASGSNTALAFGAHSPGNPNDFQCAGSPLEGTFGCQTVDATIHGFHGGSDYNNAGFGTNVFEEGGSGPGLSNQLNSADLKCTS